MLNTFRVIFVDTVGNVVTKPSTDCDYIQESDAGYYSFDWGVPAEYSDSGSVSNSISGEYAFDNRSINDMFKKYGLEPTGFVGEDPLPNIISEYGRTGEIVNSGNMGRVTKSSSGTTLSWPPSSISSQTKDAFAKDRFVIIGNTTAPLDRGGLGANLRTPSDLFTNNKGIRVIGGNDTDARDYSQTTSDLEFDQDGGGEGNVDTTGDKFPKYLYLGAVAAGGPCGGLISCRNTNLGGPSDTGFQPTCLGAVDAVDGEKGLYLCPTYRRYSSTSYSANSDRQFTWPTFTNFATVDAIGDSYIPPVYAGRVSESGKKVGVFLKVCEGSIIGNSSNRKTLIVRLVKLGKGGVESFDTRDVTTKDGGGDKLYNLAINKSSTTFPTKTDRGTEIEVYEYPEDGTALSWANHGVLSIKCDGGRAQPTIKAFTAVRTCEEIRVQACTQCVDFLTGGDAIREICVNWPSGGNNLVDEVSSNPNMITVPPKVVISKGPRFDVERYSMLRTDEGDFVDLDFNMFGGIQDIENSEDWYSKAGGIQRTEEVVTLPVTISDPTPGTGDDDEVLVFGSSFSSSYIFRGGTKYILDQSIQLVGGSEFDNNPYPLIVLGGGYDGQITENPSEPFMELKYFLDDTQVSKDVYVGAFGIGGSRRIEMTLSENADCDSLIFEVPEIVGPDQRTSKYIPSTTQVIPEPGLGAKANFIIETQNADIEDFHEGVGANGGGVYIGWGEQVNQAVDNITNTRATIGRSGASLKPGAGFGRRLIKPRGLNTPSLGFATPASSVPVQSTAEFEYISYNATDTYNNALASVMDYSPVGDPDAKGYYVGPIFRFTEMPEITREGDFYITAQAYHMEGIEKITFIMDGGEAIDVYKPQTHPDNLGTDYENTASGLGRGYKEYMVRVDTSAMDHNTTHEIRAICWPKNGYPLVLQGEKQDGARRGPDNDNPELDDSVYKLSPTIFPWQKNEYPSSVGEYVPTGINPPAVNAGDQILNLTTGEPLWYMDQDDVNRVGYHGFWFRYQNSDERKVLYVNPSYTGTSDGTKGRPFTSIDVAIDMKIADREAEEYFSAKIYVQSEPIFNSTDLVELQEAFNKTSEDPEWRSGANYSQYDYNKDGVINGADLSIFLSKNRGSVNNYWDRDGGVSRGEFENALDHSSNRSSAQNPSCQVLTIEADPNWFVNTTQSGDGYWNPDPAQPEFNNEIIMLSYAGGWNDPDYGNGQPQNTSIHYKNLRFVSGLPIDDKSSMFKMSSRLNLNNRQDGFRFKNSTLVIDSCRINSWNTYGNQMTDIDSNGRLVNGRVRFPDPNDTGENEFGESCGVAKKCTYEQITLPPMDRAGIRSVDGNSTDYDRFPDDNDLIGVNRQLIDKRLPYYDRLIGWDENANVPTSESLSDSTFKRAMAEGTKQGIALHAYNCSVWGYASGDRFNGATTVKNYLEIDCTGDSTGKICAGIMNSRLDIRLSDGFSGRRKEVNASNVVHSDLSQIDRSDNGWIDNRIISDIIMTNNVAQLGHYAGANGAKVKRDENLDLWRTSHKTRNYAMVNVIADTIKATASWNFVDSMDHLYIRGCRYRDASNSIAYFDSAGVVLAGERFDPRYEHMYYADNHEATPKFLVGLGLQGSKNAGSLGYAKRSEPYVFVEGDNQEGDLVVPVEDLQYIPLYNPAGNINDTDYTESDFQTIVRSGLKNLVNTDNSIVRWDTSIYKSPWGGGSQRVIPSQEMLNDFKQFGFNGIPVIEEAYRPTVENYSQGPPKGLPSFSDTPINYTGDPEHEAFFIPTIVGSPDDVKIFSQGYTAPPGTEERVSDLTNIQTIPSGYPNAGEPIFTYYFYDREKFYTLLANGGWSYRNFPDDYTPHKL